MMSYYSILKFINNEISQESISLGLVVISGQKLFFKVSSEKLKIANRLNPESKKLLVFSIKNLENHFKSNTNNLDFFAPKSIEYQEYLSRLSVYNNGIFQVSKPTYIKKEFDESSFKLYFENLIGKDKEDSTIINSPSLFKIDIEQKLHEPLKEQIDVNYTLKQKSLPSLFFDFHFDGLGYNGSIYGIKSIDLNASKPIAGIQSEIAEFESVIDRLNKFAENQNITGNPQYFLIMDSYRGKNLAYTDLYSILKDLPSFKLVSSDDISPLVNDIKRNEVKKLSSLLNQ